MDRVGVRPYDSWPEIPCSSVGRRPKHSPTNQSAFLRIARAPAASIRGLTRSITFLKGFGRSKVPSMPENSAAYSSLSVEGDR